MDIEDLKKAYCKKKEIYGDKAYTQISNLLAEAKAAHKIDFEQSDAFKKTKVAGKTPDHEQSWRAFKGKNLEKLISYIIEAEVKALGVSIADGNSLEKTKGENLSPTLSKVKRNLVIDYGEFGMHLPDADMIIYNPKDANVLALLSVKVTLRERIAQTGYWKLKIANQPITKHIKVFFITLDEDGTLTQKSPSKKGRAITEVDTDGCYVLSETTIQESDKVQMFDKFIVAVKKILPNKN